MQFALRTLALKFLWNGNVFGEMVSGRYRRIMTIFFIFIIVRYRMMMIVIYFRIIMTDIFHFYYSSL